MVRRSCNNGETMTDEDESVLDADLANAIELQQRRQELYDKGKYELSETEGFFCDDCEWRGLTAPTSNYTVYEVATDERPLCKCPECGEGAYTKESEVDHLKEFERKYYVNA